MAFAPSDISGLVAWFDADQISGVTADATAVSSWTDLSGNGRHLTQGSGSLQPLYKTNILNGRGAVRFDGSDDYLRVTGLTGDASQTIVAVMKKRSAPGGSAQAAITLSGGGSGKLFLGARSSESASGHIWYPNSGFGVSAMGGTAATAGIQGLKFNSDSSLDYLGDGSTSVTTNIDPADFSDATELTLGANDIGGEAGDWDFHELVVYNSALGATDYANLLAYLAYKWNVAGVRLNFYAAGAQAAATTSPQSPALPTGHAENDFLLMVLAGKPSGTAGSNDALTPPGGGGWAQIGSRQRVEIGTDDLCVDVYWKFEGAGEAAPSVTAGTAFTGSSTEGWSAQILGFRRVHPNIPLDGVTPVGSTSAAASTWTPTGVTTVGTASMVVSVVASADDNALNLSAAQTFSLLISGANYDTTSGSDHAVGVASARVQSPSAPTMPTWNQSAVGSDAWVGLTFSLRDMLSPTALTVANATHGHTADNVALTQHNVLVVADATHGHTAENVVLAVGGLVLTVADATHAHTAENVDLTQHNVLVVANATHGHTAEAVALTQHNALAVVDATHGHTAENPTLSVAGTSLTVADAVHGHVADNTALTQHNVLVVADATHGHAAENAALTQHNVLVVADALHGHTAEAVVLTQHNALGVADGAHGHTAESAALTQHNVLVVANATHGHTAESLTVVPTASLAVANATHGHTAEAVVLTQHNALTVADAAHGHTAEAVVLGTTTHLTVADSAHGHTAGAVVLTASWVPPTASGLVAWFDAAAITGKSDGDTISSWTDRSGLAHHAVQATGGARPTYKTAVQNGRPIVRFDGTDDTLGAAFTGGSTATLAIVARKRTVPSGANQLLVGFSHPWSPYHLGTNQWTTGDNGYFWYPPEAWSPLALGVTSADEAQVIVLRFNSTSSGQYYLNGDTSPTGTFDPEDNMNLLDGLVIGGVTGQFGDFDVAEVVAYGAAIPDADITALVGYLTAKWLTASVPMLEPATARHAVTSSNVVLTQHNALAVGDSAHALSSTAPTLALPGSLTVQSAVHGHSAGGLVLATKITLVVATGLHGVMSTTISWNGVGLVPANSAHGVTSGGTLLGVGLLVASTTHAHSASSPIPNIQGDVQDGAHAVRSTKVVLVPHLDDGYSNDETPVGVRTAVQSEFVGKVT